MGRQQRRQLVLLASFALVAALAVAAVWFGVHEVDEAERARGERESAVFGVRLEQVTGVEVTVEGLQTRLTRRGGEFTIAEPVPLEPDRAAVEALLSTAIGLTRRRRVEVPDEGLGPLGLAPSRARIALVLDDGSTRALLLGVENRFDESVFALMEGESAPFSIERAAARRLALRPIDLRDRRVLPFDPTLARAVRIALDGRVLALVRDEGGEWRITEPTLDRADPKGAGRLIERLAKLEGVEAVAELTDPALRLTGDERGAITVVLEGGAARHLDLARQEVGLLARDPTRTTLWRMIDEKALAELVPTLEVLLDKSLLATAGTEIQRIAFEPRDGEPFAVEREAAGDGAAWRLVGPRRVTVLQHKVVFALTTLVTLEVEAWADASPARASDLGLSPPARTVRLFGPEAAPLEVIRIGAPDAAGNVWVQIDGSGKAGRVAARRLAELPATAADVVAPAAP